MGKEKRLWMEAALTVPETLLLVGTSEGVFASIADACKLLGEDIWGAEDADALESPTTTTTGGFVSEHGHDFGVLLPTTCGLEHTIGNPLFTAAAEDLLRWRSPRSPCRSNWVSVSRRLVGDARRDVLEAQRAVERMRDAAVLDFFHAWMVLKRAPS